MFMRGTDGVSMDDISMDGAHSEGDVHGSSVWGNVRQN